MAHENQALGDIGQLVRGPRREPNSIQYRVWEKVDRVVARPSPPFAISDRITDHAEVLHMLDYLPDDWNPAWFPEVMSEEMRRGGVLSRLRSPRTPYLDDGGHTNEMPTCPRSPADRLPSHGSAQAQSSMTKRSI